MMLNLKKYFGDELLQVALLLSLLRIDRRSYLEYDRSAVRIGASHNRTDSWTHSNVFVRREIDIHPKCIDFDYEQEVSRKLNSLSLYGGRIIPLPNNAINNRTHLLTYLFNIDHGSAIDIDQQHESPVSFLFPAAAVPSTSARHDTDLSQEDLDIIEVLWKHDLHLDHSSTDDSSGNNNDSNNADESTAVTEGRLQAVVAAPADEPHSPDNSGSITSDLFSMSNNTFMLNVTDNSNDESILDLKFKNSSWFGDDVTLSLSASDPLWSSAVSPLFGSRSPEPDKTEENDVDDRLIKREAQEELERDSEDVPSSILSLSDYDAEFSLQRTLPLIDLNAGEHPQVDLWSHTSVKTESQTSTTEEEKKKEDTKSEEKEDAGIEADFLESVDFDFLIDMIHTPQVHHPRPFQSRGIAPYMRSTVSVEQRWQDLTSGFLPPADPNHSPSSSSFHHHHHHYHHHPHPHHSNSMATNYNTSASGPYSPHQLQLTSSSSSCAAAENSRNPPPPLPPSSVLHNSSAFPVSTNTAAADMGASTYSILNGNCSIGAAVSTSMHLTNNSAIDSITIADNNNSQMKIGSSSVNGPPSAFKIEHENNQEYPYQNTYGVEMNHTATEGFLSTILNDEDLQLMDMAVNEGMYPMRMMDNSYSAPQNCVERNTDSDSAVSSMGSERVPSLSSDTEWMETNSDSGHNPMDHYHSNDYHGKCRWYDNYMQAARIHNIGENSHSPRIPVPSIPQKKYQLYGRRYFHEQQQNTGATFSRFDSVAHNHTYHTHPETTVDDGEHFMTKPLYKDKKSKSGRKEDEQMSRDEKRARDLNIPISVYDIINLPMDEFNERLSKYDLSEPQLSLIRDIRRRGKNKVAAQNCRKRKMDQITSLADEVKQVKTRKDRLIQERDYLVVEKQRIQNLYRQLYGHVFQSLRDPDGNPYSPYEYSLQQSADGSVILVPRNSTSSATTAGLPSMDHQSNSHHNSRTKNKDVDKS